MYTCLFFGYTGCITGCVLVIPDVSKTLTLNKRDLSKIGKCCLNEFCLSDSKDSHFNGAVSDGPFVEKF